jgi:hypothetical protein
MVERDCGTPRSRELIRPVAGPFGAGRNPAIEVPSEVAVVAGSPRRRAGIQGGARHPVMHVGPVIAVTDLDRAREFYEGKLGLRQCPDMGGWSVAADEGTVVYLLPDVPSVGSADWPVASFRVDHAPRGRCVAWSWRPVSRSGRPIVPARRGRISVSGEMQVAWIRDPDGSVLTVYSLSDGTQAERKPAVWFGQSRDSRCGNLLRTTTPGETVGGRPEPSADLLRQFDMIPPGRGRSRADSCLCSAPPRQRARPPSTGPSPCSLSPSSTKNAVAAARSSTTMPTCSMRWIVMRSTAATRRPSYSDLKRPAMSRSAQSGHSWVRELNEDAQ